MRPWIAKTVTELSGVEDDIVIEYTMELLENPENPASLSSELTTGHHTNVTHVCSHRYLTPKKCKSRSTAS